ncbi:hypothetical protein T4B_3145 [Trichinella pseudospiralis]|uniref:Uncharacterized protein n=1 Tax=Trichinella pseudospiralis TaxID=6337 RepID=A0A0V1JKH3_TRIPS|nr:hypothetical protein T4B_3145 [Trichinella pseudospiralis]
MYKIVKKRDVRKITKFNIHELKFDPVIAYRKHCAKQCFQTEKAVNHNNNKFLIDFTSTLPNMECFRN